MFDISTTLSFYKRRDIQEELVKQAENKEVAINFRGGFGKRPDVLKYPDDVLELAKQGATSFHASEELWSNPTLLTPNLRQHELNELRIGWDLILDIDCALFEYSKIAAKQVIDLLKQYKINSVTLKFSGNKGFHIAVAYEAFPEKIGNQHVKDLFPEAPRRIAEYIKNMIKEKVSRELLKLEKQDFHKISQKTGFAGDRIIRFEKNEFGDLIPMLNAEPFLNIDTILISPRHLYRMPYSFHEKSGLISVPLDPSNFLNFQKEDAHPENVKITNKFLDRTAKKGEASRLFIDAFDFKPVVDKKGFSDSEDDEQIGKREKGFISDSSEKIPEAMFPPCIKKILRGLEDGRKRALFILTNFLSSCGWTYDEIEKRLQEWNHKNREALKETYFVSQLRYHKQNKKTIPPPNCDKYYKDLGVCEPDDLCQRIKNPLQYAKKKGFRIAQDSNIKKATPRAIPG